MEPCRNCSGYDCGRCGGLGFVAARPVPVETSDVRLALEKTYLDYANQAFQRGDWVESETWRKAADIARGFTTRGPVRL